MTKRNGAGNRAARRRMATGAVIADGLAACHEQIAVHLVTAGLGTDVETVHQLRVGLRRLLTLLAILKAEDPATGSPDLEELDAEARHLVRMAGSLRNWDILVADVLTEINVAVAPADGLADLVEAAEALRSAGRERLRAAIAAPRTVQFMQALERAAIGWRSADATETEDTVAEVAVAPFAARALERLYRRVRRRGHGFRSLPPEERHRLRLALKALRYAAEFFADVLGKGRGRRAYLKRLSHLQDALGATTDIRSTNRLLTEIMATHATSEVAHGCGLVRGWQLRRQVETGAELRDAWRRFKNTPPFWRRRS